MKTARPGRLSKCLSLLNGPWLITIILLTTSLTLSACSTGSVELLARKDANLARLGEIRAELVRYQELSATPTSQLSVDEVAERDNLSNVKAQREQEMYAISGELKATYEHTNDDSYSISAGVLMVLSGIWTVLVAALIAAFAACSPDCFGGL